MWYMLFTPVQLGTMHLQSTVCEAARGEVSVSVRIVGYTWKTQELRSKGDSRHLISLI